MQLVGLNRPGMPGHTNAPYLLDHRADVACAFSMRRLCRAYTGALLRLRRSSDNAEQDFAARDRWLDWDALSAWLGGAGGFVVKWYDQSGLGRDLAQSTASAQPQIILAANGKPAGLFDGSNDNLRTASFTVAQPWSFNIVYRRVSVVQTGQEYVFDGLTGDRTVLVHNISGTPTDNGILAGAAYINSDVGVTMATGVRGAVAGALNGASSRMEIDATQVASFTGSPGAAGLNGLTLGTYGALTPGLSSNIEVQEWVLFSTAHSSGLLAADNAAMRAAWGF